MSELNRFPQKDLHLSILTELERTFGEAGLLVKLLNKEEAGLFDTLLVEHQGLGAEEEDVLGQYYFLPDQGESPICHFFVVSVTLTESLNYAVSDDLMAAIAAINNLTPKGTFLADGENGSLEYRYMVSIPVSGTKEQILDLIRKELMISLSTIALWIDILFALNDETADIRDFYEFLSRRLG